MYGGVLALIGLGISVNTVFEGGASVKGIQIAARHKKRIYKTTSYIALTSLLVGFLLQRIAQAQK